LFVYTADIDLTDAFGNPYHIKTSPTSVTVAISATKVALQTMAAGQIQQALIMLAAAAALWVAAAIPSPSSIGAAVAAGIATAIGMYFLREAITNSLQANDPPVPDFNHGERVQLNIPSPPVYPSSDRASLVAFKPLIELLSRISASYDALGKIHQKMIGAYIDGAYENLRLQAERYRDVMKVLQRTAEFFPGVAMEAELALAADDVFTPEKIGKTINEWKENGLPTDFRERLRKEGLKKEELKRLEKIVRSIPVSEETPASVIRKLSATVLQFIHDVEAEATTILDLENR
jgi:hypothetical protein